MSDVFLFMSESNVANYADNVSPYACEKNCVVHKESSERSESLNYLSGSMITTSKLVVVNLMPC